jgi:hypothetical protein
MFDMQGPRTERLRRVLSLALAVGVLSFAGCSAPPAAERSFRIEYATGAIPPPYNYQYVVEATFTSAGVEVAYSLAYPYREGMSDEELQTQGYSRDDAIEWQGEFGPDVAAAWRELARSAVLVDPAARPPGADSLVVRIDRTDGSSLAGVPPERDEWVAVAAAVDAAARGELGSARPAP